MRTAVLFLVFNRPAPTREAFAAIRSARPPRLYVAADGPREGRVDDAAQCKEVRTIATAVDWPCEVRALFRESNVGCKRAVSDAISWFFQHEPEGVIVEDDCVVDVTFFRFCEELLERYRHDARVMSIGAPNIQLGRQAGGLSYYFSRYSLMWGWATWRRGWDLYDIEMKDWPNLKKNGWLQSIGEGRWPFVRAWTRIFDACHAGQIDTWDYQWIYSCWLHGGVTVLPNVNLVRNLGFGYDSTHTREDDAIRGTLQLKRMGFPLVHPANLHRARDADRYLDRFWFQISWENEIKAMLRAVPGIDSLARFRRWMRAAIQAK